MEFISIAFGSLYLSRESFSKARQVFPQIEKHFCNCKGVFEIFKRRKDFHLNFYFPNATKLTKIKSSFCLFNSKSSNKHMTNHLNSNHNLSL